MTGGKFRVFLLLLVVSLIQVFGFESVAAQRKQPSQEIAKPSASKTQSTQTSPKPAEKKSNKQEPIQQTLARKIPSVFENNILVDGVILVYLMFDDDSCSGVFKYVLKDGKWQIEKGDPVPKCLPRKFMAVGKVKEGTAVPAGARAGEGQLSYSVDGLATAGPGGLNIAITVELDRQTSKH
jgi:hypothetical protein